MLNSIETALESAKTIVWRGVASYSVAWRCPDRPSAGPCLQHRCPPLPRVFRPIAERLERSISLPKWSLVINP